MSDAHSHDSAAHGSVAQEAQRLVEALADWAGEGARVGSEDSSHHSAGDSCGSAADEHAPAQDGCTCGAEHAPRVCRVCPVCRIGAFLEQVSPEVVDRCADLFAMVAGSLRTVADDRRAAQERSGPSPRRPVPRDDDAFEDEPQQ